MAITMAVDNQNSNTPKEEKDLGQTPWWFIRSLESFVGMKINIDVCCLPSTAKADQFFSLEGEDPKDCFKEEWIARDDNCTVYSADRTVAYCNPPFSNIMPFIERAVNQCEENQTSTLLLIPNNPETAYRRKLKEISDTFIEMPFRMKFMRPNGERFFDKNGNEQGPKFSCAVGLITPLGLKVPCRVVEHDFRIGFYEK